MLKFSEMGSPEISRKKQLSQSPRNKPASARAVEPPAVVDPVWLLKAFCIAVAAALACAYASLCFLLYQGQWQLILHPKRSATVPVLIGDAPVKLLHFGTDETGTPQLTAWVVPAIPNSRYKDVTVLFLPSGDGSLVDEKLTLSRLHEVGVTLFAIDYRGYGQSTELHPDEKRMQQDTETALTYLTTSRSVPEKQIVLYGVGLGASLATDAAGKHATISAIILDAPGKDGFRRVSQDTRTHFLPVSLLLHERFSLAEPLSKLRTPKLLIYGGEDAAFLSAADPKMAAVRTISAQIFSEVLSRFLDQFVMGVNAELRVAAPKTTQRNFTDR